MKRKSILLSLLLAIFVVGGMFAQEPTYSKMSPYTRILLDKLAKKDTANSLLRSSISGDYLSAFVKVATDEGWAFLDSAGCRIRTRTGDIATVLIPLSAVESVSELGCIQYVSASQPMRASMDSARYYSDVADAYAGTKLPQPYTGKGVIVGVVDQGLDFTHPNFYDKEGKAYRIKQVWDQTSPYSKAEYRTEEELLDAACSFDSDVNTHGTHVAGIAAGGGFDTPYQGVANESDMILVATTMQNSDIVDGVDYIFKESERLGRPCVVNLSLGDGIGGHDGTNFMDIMLDRMVGPGKIITVAMGNSRDMPVYTEQMSPSDTLHTFVGRSNTGLSYGLVDIWADEPGEPFSVCLDLYDRESDEILNTTGFFALDTMPKSSVFTSESVDGTLVYEAQMESELYVFNGRYRLFIQFNYPEGTKNEKIFLLHVATNNTPVRAWGNNGESLFTDLGKGYPYTVGTGDFTVGSPASAKNVIAVGAYATRICPVNVDGGTSYLAGNSLGELTSFSSVGPTLDNRMKPDITAPGLWVASSYNSFYLEGETGEGAKASQARYSTFNGHRYPWGYMSGTSMACPFVTGSIALWLQANPALSPDDIKDVFSRTAVQDKPLSYPNKQWGWGKIDVYKGLLDILGIPTSTENVFEEAPQEAVSVYASGTKGSFHVRWAEVPGSFSIHVHDASGRHLYGEKVDSPASVDYAVSLGNVQPGVYFIRIDTAEGTVERKIRI